MKEYIKINREIFFMLRNTLLDLPGLSNLGLTMMNCRLNDESLIYLGEILRTQRRLIGLKISLQQNLITKDGLEIIIGSIRDCQRIMALSFNFQNNKIDSIVNLFQLQN
ncbi:hypothetical protein PPERSA_04484 [Pseudocohnilembus persalinus]|uniref:Uncharacterized protein n=1 Tax=Pseudocohnilembus persalinus TaxID=266149 RepID=A0A0V0QR65_PSEPJ|nr:hypothetical protein PPERSA_04484 [Pseudocohnilembus persalinus]|eukprot:KRX04669.1 hypothetical protein PPERSA_04484 [Pseudocohnilembus persalinus]